MAEQDPLGRNRSERRDSLLLLTVVTSPEGQELGRAKVRNLSTAGMMAEIDRRVQQGHRIAVALRGIGRVTGTVAWSKGDRIGVIFDEPVDPQQARKPINTSLPEDQRPDYLRPLPILPKKAG
jgi:hypothetical protein